jgi:hypothetical protein
MKFERGLTLREEEGCNREGTVREREVNIIQVPYMYACMKCHSETHYLVQLALANKNIK